MRGILLYACCLYTLRCILLYRVNADMVYLLLLEKNSFSLCPPLVCSAMWARGWALWRRGGCHIKKTTTYFLKPINTDIYGTIIEQADL